MKETNDAQQDYLVSFPFMFGSRALDVTVGHDGFSYWFDSFAQVDAVKRDPDLILKAAFLRGERLKYLDQIRDEWTIKALVPEVELREIREVLSPRYWADSCDHDWDLEKRLKAILEPIFWKDVNPQLSVPIDP